ncbi:immunoglobulin superfamily member 6 [Tachyglossus aculeatus]|uniref:immunoglobulin superfamily member 6 n=1 Tax=Tachyglossus aculeatus TaxID=9261 RepID=UPI0018F485FC|nr:immunoglobulin superfamily member 6 [Tachyglossus aculeatus]
MDTMNHVKIILALKINLILSNIGSTKACQVTVRQPSLVEVDYTCQEVTIQCHFSASGCPNSPPEVLWFRQHTHQPDNLCPNKCPRDMGKFTLTGLTTSNDASLTVKAVSLNDSAIYFCGIAFLASDKPGSKQTGGGTMLVVRGTKLLDDKEHKLLIALSSLLSLYIIALFATFIILYRSKFKILRKTGMNEEPQQMNKKSGRRIFQEIARELHLKRYVETNPESVREDIIYENRRVHSNLKY